MGYVKGSILISEESDIPLLRHVRDCRFVSRLQLFSLLQHDAAHLPASSYSSRLNRLVRHDYIRTLSGQTHRASAIYFIAPKGLLELESHGEYCLAIHSETRHMPQPLQVHHCLELTDIRLVLMGTSSVRSWTPEVQVVSENLACGTYQKDYDAVVRVQNGREVHQFALEYERTLKGAYRYQAIRLSLEREREVQSVVYMTPTLRLAKLLSRHLTPNSKPLAFIPVHQFRQHLFATPVMTNLPGQIMSLDCFFSTASARSDVWLRTFSPG
jgi:hypothetical protein